MNAAKHEGEAAGYWDQFYRFNNNKFFKVSPPHNTHGADPQPSQERHYLHYQFSDLNLVKQGGPSTPQQENKKGEGERKLLQEEQDVEGGESMLEGKVLMECGCGTGSTVFPLMAMHPKASFIAFDISPHAVSLVKVRPPCLFVCGSDFGQQKANPLYNESGRSSNNNTCSRITAFVYDASKVFTLYLHP